MKSSFKEKLSADDACRPAALLQHRGPDGWAWWSNGAVLLLQTRLSIVDLAGGTQPLISFDGRFVGIVNGELYDYEIHRTRLEGAGVSFKTGSDSEVLLNLYAKYGIAGLANLSGEFAFIFYDQVQNQIHYGRDLIGVKPLFVKLGTDSFMLASEMKALVPDSFALNQNYLRTYLAHALTPPDTAIEGIEHVWPGQVHVYDCQTREVRSSKFETLPLFQERSLSGQEAVDAVQEELVAAVKRRLRADVEVGCYLSGGIDSALVAAIASKSSEKLKAFTVGFADAEFDESKIAADIAKELGLAHSVIELNSKNFMSSLKSSIRAFENPISNPHGAAKNVLSSLAAKEVKVVLSGEGADEWFGGYAYLRINKIKSFQAKHPELGKAALAQFLARESEMNLGHLDGHSSEFSQIATQTFGGQVPSILGRVSGSQAYQKVLGQTLESVFENVCKRLQDRFKQEMGKVSPSVWDLDTWIAVRSDLLQYILSNVGDRQEMAHSLEGRTPFLDIKLLRVAGRVKENTLVRGLQEKYVLRQVSQKYLSPQHQKRRKKPFFAPIKYLFQKENREQVDYYLGLAKLATPQFNWKQIDHLLCRGEPIRSLKDRNELVFYTLFFFSLGVLVQELTEISRPISREEALDHERVF